MQRSMVVAVLTMLVLAAACGKTEIEKRTEDAAKGAEQAAKGLEQMAKGLEALTGGGTGADLKAVEPVSFRDLQTAFGDLDGWEKGKPTGERMSSPVSFSQAEVSYTKGDSRIQAKIVDSGFNQILLAPFALFLTAGYEKETATGYEKSIAVAGYPGWEQWNQEGKDGSLNAVVNKRFLVSFEGNGIDSTAVLHELAGRTDLGKLAAMK